MRTHGYTQIFADSREDIVYGNIFFDQLDSSVSSFMGYDNACFFQFIGGFSEEWLFDGELLAYCTDGMDSGIVSKMFYEQESVFSGGGDFEHRKWVESL